MADHESVESDDKMRKVARRMAGGLPTYKYGGLAYALSTLSSYDMQRITTTGRRVHGAEDVPLQPYGTPNAMEMLRMSRTVQGSRVPRVAVKGIPERPFVIATAPPEKFYVLVRIKAPSMTQYRDHPLQRAPIDLLIALDFSEGIEKPALDHVRDALAFVIDNLEPSDRLSILSSCASPEKVFPFRRMSQQGQEAAKDTVNTLVFTKGATKFVDILTVAALVLEQRRYLNPAAFIILLSDRRDTTNTLPLALENVREMAISDLEELPIAVYPPRESSDYINNYFETPVFPVYAFGIGKHHEPFALHEVCSATGGTYSYLENYEILRDAIACRIGALLSVVTLQFCLTLTRGTAGVNILDIHSGDFYNNICEEDKSIGEIKVRHLFADETKEFLIAVSLPARRLKPKEACLGLVWTYKDSVLNDGREHLYCDTVDIYRTLIEPHPMSNRVHSDVIRTRACLYFSLRIHDAIRTYETKGFIKAREFLRNQISEIKESESVSNEDKLSIWMLIQIQEVVRTMLEGSRSFKNGGIAVALSTLSSHDTQTTTILGSEVPGTVVHLFQPYGTPNTMAMVTKSILQLHSSTRAHH
ncbi:probable E3 ubiquitin-protein ligase WAVH2 [Andrographis paniculata]|uniref:probable E3 ubiquitin-protein ligase WAVH2 n=1 Tax=Andrographis paniculata TaxID=175694 RepID=UPI0021E8254A|nr:probable E3 ubiquitin-protein ligase WAVH2 [Andrographis paniculata]